MSHISTIEVEIKDLATLERACAELGLEFARDQRDFTYYAGKGQCDHAIRVPGARYEVGVVKSETGYGLQWDDLSAGGLRDKLGEGAGLLKQAYAVERVRAEARKRKMRVRTRRTENEVELVLTA